MDADLLRSKGVQPERIRTALLPGFALRIGQRAALVPAEGSRVHGILMDLTHGEIDQLYAEASVGMYRAEPVLCECQGALVAALAFNLPVPPEATESNAAYAEKLRDLGRRLQLPPEYVDAIR